jgi:hypothetical protein
MESSHKKVIKKWLLRFHLFSPTIKLIHFSHGFQVIITKREILRRITKLTYLYSQKESDTSFAGESAYLKFVTDNLSISTKFCVDIAASNGIEMSSTLQFFRSGWSGIAVEYDRERFSQLAFCYQSFPHVTLLCEKVTPSNAVDILRVSQTPKDFGVLNLDIDSYDLEVLLALFQGGYRPQVLSMEINEKIPPRVYFNVLYTPSHVWNGDNFYGCSLTAASKNLRPFGYILVNLQYNNAIYVHKDSIPTSSDCFMDLNDFEAYELGYRLAVNRRELFPWNKEMEFLLDIPPEQAVDEIRLLFAKYENTFDLWVE